MAKSSATSTKSTIPTSGLAKLQSPKVHPKAHAEVNSYKTFTVFTPNPNKRKHIRKTIDVAERRVRDDLHLSQATGYVSLSPKPVGGCLTLEQVRMKQQQELNMKSSKTGPD